MVSRDYLARWREAPAADVHVLASLIEGFSQTALEAMASGSRWTHHLQDYLAGMGEMLRVTIRAVSISEPTRATATKLSVRLGFSLTIEDAGTPVRRVPISEVAGFTQARGFGPLSPRRYAMYYRHQPGRVVRVLSRKRLARMSLVAFRLFNQLFGGIGNKMAVQAVRDGMHSPVRVA
jgi:hypothetical protein